MRDHQIFGKQILMGLAYLSISINEGLKAFGDKSFAINKILFSNPLVLEAGENATLKCSFNALTTRLNRLMKKNGQLTKSSIAELKPIDDFSGGQYNVATLKNTSTSFFRGNCFL